MVDPTNLYAFKVALRGVTPMIWRRLQVCGNTSLADLHSIIQIAVGWDDNYLHRFHIYGEDYGISYVGGLYFSHNVHQVFIDDFGFDAGDRFTYTYNFFAHWLCDIRVEAITQSSSLTPKCTGSSGRQGDSRYYKIDEIMALIDVVDAIIHSEKTTPVSEIRPIIDHYEAIRFHLRSINRQLTEHFAPLAE